MLMYVYYPAEERSMKYCMSEVFRLENFCFVGKVQGHLFAGCGPVVIRNEAPLAKNKQSSKRLLVSCVQGCLV